MEAISYQKNLVEILFLLDIPNTDLMQKTKHVALGESKTYMVMVSTRLFTYQMIPMPIKRLATKINRRVTMQRDYERNSRTCVERFI